MHQEITITLERNLVSKITQSSENRDGGEIKREKEREEILSSKSLPTLPKYKLMEKMFLME